MYNDNGNRKPFKKNSRKQQKAKRVIFDHERVNNSVFRNGSDEASVKAMLLTVVDGLGNLEKDDRGLLDIFSVAEVIAEKNDSLSHITAVHLIEIYLKDPDEIIRLEGQRIGVKNSHFITPPELLYFGTTERYFDSMVMNGIHSSTKPFVRLYSNEDDAIEFARQFLRFGQDSDCIRTIEVLAGKAFTDGVKFSSSEKGGEFLTSAISPNYINEIIEDHS